MYVGLAVRTALAMGINREPGHRTKKQPAQIRAESRTWWYDHLVSTLVSDKADIFKGTILARDVYCTTSMCR